MLYVRTAQKADWIRHKVYCVIVKATLDQNEADRHVNPIPALMDQQIKKFKTVFRSDGCPESM